jgi:hypothetical protein
MRTKIGLIVLFLGNAAIAAPQMMVAEQPNLTVRLFPQPCIAEKVLALTSAVAPGKDFYAGSVTWKGKDYVSCWSVLDEQHVLIVDETGDAGAVPVAAFRVVDGI